jgi:hypothetical protein
MKPRTSDSILLVPGFFRRELCRQTLLVMRATRIARSKERERERINWFVVLFKIDIPMREPDHRISAFSHLFSLPAALHL